MLSGNKIMKRTSRKYKNDYKDISYRFSDELDSMDIDEWKKEIAYNCSPYTVTQLSAVLDLIDTVEDIILNDIPGDLVECGVFMGGSCMIMAETLKHHNTNRTIWMFDTFDGVPSPNDEDVTPEGTSLKQWYEEQKLDDNNESKWCYSALDTVKDNFKECDYTGAVNFVIGNVEDTIPTIGLSNIALLRIDVDLAKPTRHVLDNFYSLISTNGHLILDDYGHFPAVKMTVDDYFKDDTIELIEISYTVRRMVK